jgi:hypothetical protein
MDFALETEDGGRGAGRPERTPDGFRLSSSGSGRSERRRGADARRLPVQPDPGLREGRLGDHREMDEIGPCGRAKDPTIVPTGDTAIGALHLTAHSGSAIGLGHGHRLGMSKPSQEQGDGNDESGGQPKHAIMLSRPGRALAATNQRRREIFLRIYVPKLPNASFLVPGRKQTQSRPLIRVPKHAMFEEIGQDYCPNYGQA